MNVVWTPRAISDRDKQLNHIAESNPQAAIDQGDRIDQQTDLLQDDSNSEIGRAGRKKGTREWVINGTPFIVVYRIKTQLKRIEIIRILHGAQQWMI